MAVRIEVPWTATIRCEDRRSTIPEEGHGRRRAERRSPVRPEPETGDNDGDFDLHTEAEVPFLFFVQLAIMAKGGVRLLFEA